MSCNSLRKKKKRGFYNLSFLLESRNKKPAPKLLGACEQPANNVIFCLVLKEKERYGKKTNPRTALGSFMSATTSKSGRNAPQTGCFEDQEFKSFKGPLLEKILHGKLTVPDNTANGYLALAVLHIANLLWF